jgi:TetR/AcrR family transcriptional regulator, transcriptional repressor of aconitase
MNSDINSRILTGAADLFFEYGFSKVSMDEIAEHAGVVKKTIYNHFPSKAVLAGEVIRTQIEMTIDHLDSIAGSSELNFIEKLEHIVEYLFEEFSSRKKHLFREYYKYTGPDLQEKITPEIRNHIIELTQNLLREGIARGVVRKEVPKEVLPYLYITIVEGLTSLYGSTDIPFTPGELLLELINLTFTGLLTHSGRTMLEQRNSR